eukprot:TRINITY_DN10574_c0_g1_i1.p1 TRINITY_DN10574_c0_g1~~TRINITY_DN10574_c0_g1_i1.p1  ORF type:complete len:653 (-),score=102.18 TRINITY_DN10574_c0_g1_i1:48-2006(-)
MSDQPSRGRGRTIPITSIIVSDSAPPTSPPSPHIRRRTGMALGMNSSSAQALFQAISNVTAMQWSGMHHSASANSSPAADIDNDRPRPTGSPSPKRFIHRRSVSQSSGSPANNAGGRRKSFRAHRLSVVNKNQQLDHPRADQKEEPEILQDDNIQQALIELHALVVERKHDNELCLRLTSITNFLTSFIVESSVNRAEQIEKAMVAEVLDYESNDLMPQAEMFAKYVSRHFLSPRRTVNPKVTRLKRLKMVQSSPAPDEAKTPRGSRRKSDDLLIRFDPRKLDDPSAPDSQRVRLSSAFETSFGALRMLIRLDTWDYFDVFAFGEATHGKPLRSMLIYLYTLLNFEVIGVDSSNFMNFAEAVENGYNVVPYHGKYHAADVVQAVYYFFQNTQIQRHVGGLDLFASIISAAVHDFGHRGRSNNFEIDAESGIALRYNDQSVLENHHASLAFRMVQVPECNILKGFKRSVRKELREKMIQMILGTDLKGHFASVANLKATIESHRKAKTWFDANNQKDRELLLVQCVHSADISSPCKPARLAVEWTNRLEQEWFEEGDEQKVMGLQVGPMMDRSNPCTEQSQFGFLKFIVQPLMVPFSDAIGKDAFKPILHNLDLNMQFWQKKVQSNTTSSPKTRLAEVSSQDSSALSETKDLQ